MKIRLLPESYRRRRRLAWISGFLAVAGAMALLVIVLPKPEPLADDVSDEEADVYVEPKRARMTPERRAAIGATIDEFVDEAVLRRDPAAAWSLATPTLRGGSTRAEWARREAPVLPYPAQWFELADWQVQYSYENLVGVDVRVMPKFRSGGYIQVYTAELLAVRQGERKRWLVDSWFPAKVVQPAEGAPPPKPKPKSNERAAAPPEPPPPDYEEPKGRLGARWLLLPAALVVALLGTIPIAVVVRNRIDARRAGRPA